MEHQKRKALLVGINDYPGHKLKYCVKDTQELHKLLSTHYDGAPNFSCEVLTSSALRPVTKSILASSLKQLLLNNSELVLFYFSGHGYSDEMGTYLVAQDAAQDDPGISLCSIINLINKSEAKQKIIILDCCFSGNIGNVNDKLAFLKKGTCILASSSELQTSKEQYEGGVFTALVLDALEGGTADALGNVTLGSINSHVNMLLGPWDQQPLSKTYLSNNVIIRKTEPKVAHTLLRRLPKLFKPPEYTHALSPEYEPSILPNNPDKEQLFGQLQLLARAGLVRPLREKHMYYAAVKSDSCVLTRMGQFYWKLASKGNI